MDQLRSEAALREDQADYAEALQARIRAAAARLDAAVKASKAGDPSLGQSCIVAVTAIPALAASVESVQFKDNKAAFRNFGGQGFYTFDPPPKGLSVQFASSSDKNVNVSVTSDATLKPGKYDLTFYHGAATPSSVKVTVEQPALAAQ